MNQHPIIIIGTGLAGYHLAKEFRKLDQLTPLQLITSDRGRYYSKPTLSNAFTQQKALKDLALADAKTMHTRLQAEIFTETQVDGIDAQQKHLIAAGKYFPYSKLILACGASQIRPSIQGNAIDQVSTINNLIQYEQFRQRLGEKKHIAIIGAGFIGCEFANDLNNTGYQVSVIADSPYPLDRLLPEAVGNTLKNALSQEGIEWFLQKTVTRIDKIDGKFQITMHDGTKLFADHVLMSIGLRANTKLAKEANLQTHLGITTNAYLETTAHDIYALGDCAEINGRIQQFVAPINHCAKALARTLTGNRTAVNFPPMPIIVKTPSYPITIVNPSTHKTGRWKIEIKENNAKALLHSDDKHKLKSFILAGKDKSLLLTQRELLLKMKNQD